MANEISFKSCRKLIFLDYPSLTKSYLIKYWVCYKIELNLNFSIPWAGASSCCSTPTSPWWSTRWPSGSPSPSPSGGSSWSILTCQTTADILMTIAISRLIQLNLSRNCWYVEKFVIRGSSWSSSPQKQSLSAQFQDARWFLPLDMVNWFWIR